MTTYTEAVDALFKLTSEHRDLVTMRAHIDQYRNGSGLEEAIKAATNLVIRLADAEPNTITIEGPTT